MEHRRRGRKRLPADLKRSHRIGCRLTNLELNQLDDLRGHSARGEYLRTLAFATQVKHIPPVNLTAWSQLNKLSGLLNQLARRANISGVIEDVEQTQNVLADTRNALIGVKPL